MHRIIGLEVSEAVGTETRFVTTLSPEIRLNGNTIIATGTASNFPRLSESAVALHIAQRRKDASNLEVVS